MFGFPCICEADISPLVAKCDDPNVAQDKDVAEVVRLLDQACREAGFFYVVFNANLSFFNPFDVTKHVVLRSRH